MKAPTMNRHVAFLLQGGVVLLGAAVLIFLLGEPHFEGRNARATIFEVYFHDPFLAYVYVGSLPFFVALYRAFGLLGDIRKKGGEFSAATVRGLRAIKRCAQVMLGFIAGALVIIVIFADGEDRPPGIMMGVVVALATSAVAFTAAKLARTVERGVLDAGT